MQQDHLEEPVTAHMRKDFAAFDQDMTVGAVLESIREKGVGEEFSYIYILGPNQDLMGSIPVRRLLMSRTDVPLRELILRRSVWVGESATLYEACELFLMHRLLALPVLDEKRRILGVLDVSLYTDEMLSVARRQEVDDVFHWVGIRLDRLKQAGVLKAYCHRLPWLLATFAGGILCAIIVTLFQATLDQALVLGAFLTVALGLGESVCVQAMTISVQNLQDAGNAVPLRARILREVLTTALLGVTVGVAVGLIAFAFKRWTGIAISIGVSIWLAAVAANLIGSFMPHVVRRFSKEPRAAAGPIALALTNAFTVLLYFGLATIAI